MSIIIVSKGKELEPWVEALKEKRPDLDLRIHPDTGNHQDVAFALAWNHPIGAFQEYPNLKCISSMGAGVDHILKDPNIPEQVTVTRIIDENLTQDMGEFVAAQVLSYTRTLQEYKAQQAEQTWQPLPYKRAKEVRVGVMGLGKLGAHVAKVLTALGFQVSGWAKSEKKLDEVAVYTGQEAFDGFLAEAEVLVCLLPLTEETKGILNKDTLAKLPQGAYVINVARGEHVVEEDLLEMLDKGHLSGAALDVFEQEPLPQGHPFWKHPRVFVTPHMASKTDPASVVPQVLENYDRLKSGKPLQNIVSSQKGY
ncbi:2-hydroxyacid dehydrogenase [Pontibacter actiniarum]|uniref:Glyoxylate/hydroxypyruvate reductase A n=1 Tax=Pontibacter actiniarum TaxID=323450 RepID=A0A1X9YNX1_9BACT|nr:glyoxylate/hydroxypyruvate reductase A [Pontibacter actiniarum]ARS34552.1 glyoxylate/hydroxypyruvate reductase A [Pontibacter actiniarum]